MAKATKQTAANKKAAKVTSTTSARTLYGGWNKKRTALLTYDINGEWKSKVAATKAPELIKSGELAPISSVYENRKAADPKDIFGRAIELADAKAAKRQSSADARQKADADRKAKKRKDLQRLGKEKAAGKAGKAEADGITLSSSSRLTSH